MPQSRQLRDALLRALRNRNYRLYFFGQGISLIGTWLTKIATSWLVYRLAQEHHYSSPAAMLGWTNFAGMFPTLVLGPLGGAVVDRYNRQRLLILTQVLSLLQSAALAILTFMGSITIPQVLWLSVLQGALNAFDMPGRQAFLIEIIEDRADLPNAIAMNSSLFNGARLIGPAIAGSLIAVVGEAWCFGIDALSYVAVVLALLAMRVPRHSANVSGRNMLTQMKAGFTYSFGFAPIRSLLLLVATVSFFTMPFLTLTPIIADRLKGGLAWLTALGFSFTETQNLGALSYGLLMAASGVGALTGSMFLAARSTVLGLGRVIQNSALLLGVAIVTFGLSSSLALSVTAMLAGGFGMIASFASVNTILQTIVPDEKRGRVMALYTMAMMGMAPLGSVVAGALAGKLGENPTIILSGVGCIIASLLFALQLPALRALIRPIYHSKGIMPEIAAGMEAASELTAPPEN